MKKSIHMVTSSKNKALECKSILELFDIDLKIIYSNISEELTIDIEKIIKEKTIAAFKIVQEPVFVEHGGLFIDAFDGFPGGLSKPFVEVLKHKICDIIPKGFSREAEARLYIGYCDGRDVRIFQSKIKGKISFEEKGDRDYYYDKIFIPYYSTKTFSEMSKEEKYARSHVRDGYSQFAKHLKNHGY